MGNAYGGNYASPVGVYTDDNYLAARTMHGMQLYDLERVEVLRGPQPTGSARGITFNVVSVTAGQLAVTIPVPSRTEFVRVAEFLGVMNVVPSDRTEIGVLHRQPSA